MASIRLDLIPPDVPGLTKLFIWEGSTVSGPFQEIETVTSIGAYPNYLSYYTTDKAGATNNWFAVEWGDAKGWRTQISAPMRAGTRTLLAEVIRRVLQRNFSLDEQVVAEEAEAALEKHFGVNPYTLTIESITKNKYQTINGLTYLVMARAMLAMMAQSSSIQSATIGLVSFKTGETAPFSTSMIEDLIEMANKELGVITSVVLLLEDIEQGSLSGYDHSRLISWVGLK